jgi:LytS/YehU family sensor histidine kinase|nr:MAG TPA: hypothetical protein [Caudoviricetes sp.]
MNLIEKINITEVVAVVGLVATLIISVLHGMNELTMSIGSGLVGYIGGNAKTAVTKRGDNEK